MEGWLENLSTVYWTCSAPRVCQPRCFSRRVTLMNFGHRSHPILDPIGSEHLGSQVTPAEPTVVIVQYFTTHGSNTLQTPNALRPAANWDIHHTMFATMLQGNDTWILRYHYGQSWKSMLAGRACWLLSAKLPCSQTITANDPDLATNGMPSQFMRWDICDLIKISCLD